MSEDDWKLQNDASNRIVKRVDTKEDATARGALKRALGEDGGSVRIEKVRGGYQEDGTFPSNKDAVAAFIRQPVARAYHQISRLPRW
jgi:hypothetical protein